MKIERGDIYTGNLSPIQGSEQGGIRPVIIFQKNTISQFTTTIITIPLTTNLKRISLPSSLLIPQNEGGLNQDSVALCHQLRVLDKARLVRKIGRLSPKIIDQIENIVLFTLGYI